MINDAARILTKQFILPFLLGLKFNLMTILPLLFAGIILLLKKAVFLGKFALFITGLLGFGNLFSFGQFGGVNSFYPTPFRPFGNQPGPLGPLGDSFVGGPGGIGGIGGVGGGGLGGGGGYYKSASPSASITFHEFATTEKELPYADQFYNFEKKILHNKSAEKSLEKEAKEPINEQSGRASTYRNFVWQSDQEIKSTEFIKCTKYTIQPFRIRFRIFRLETYTLKEDNNKQNVFACSFFFKLLLLIFQLIYFEQEIF